MTQKERDIESKQRYYLKNREAILKYKKEYRKKHKEKLNKLDKEWRENNKDIITSNNKQWRENNPEHNKQWHKNNPDKHNEYSRNSYSNNIKVREYSKEYYKRWSADNKDKMRVTAKKYYRNNAAKFAWRRVLRSSLYRMDKTKSGSTIDLLGYSADDLKIHLTNLLTEGMTWGNYGEWHIDHIKAVSTFDLETPAHIVNALSNLQPLWAVDNIKKRNK